MKNINACLDGARRTHQVHIHFDQCFEADFYAWEMMRTTLVAKGFGSTVESALADLDRALEGYDADNIHNKKAW